jgi:hypothetical protein
MQELTTRRVILQELDKAIAENGKLVYFNHAYGTTSSIDPVYILRLERARQMMSSLMPSEDMIHYAKDLLTIKRHYGQ